MSLLTTTFPEGPKYRGRDAVRYLYLVPVPGHAVPADAVRLVGHVDRARVSGWGDGRDPVYPDGSLLGRFGPTPLTGLAFTCLVLAYAVFLRAGVHPDYPTVMLPATLLVGLAFGLGFSSLSVAATAGVPNAEQGLAASLFQTSFQVGGAVVLAIVTAVVDAGGAVRLASAPATLAAYRPALGLITGVAAIGMLVALNGLRRRPTQRVELPGNLGTGNLGTGNLGTGNLGTGNLRVGELTASGLEADKVSGERGDGAAVGDLADELAAGELAAGEMLGRPALQQAADVAGGSTEA